MKSGFGQFCPLAMACEVFAARWTPIILRELFAGSHRFNEIHRAIPLISLLLLRRWRWVGAVLLLAAVPQIDQALAELWREDARQQQVGSDQLPAFRHGGQGERQDDDPAPHQLVGEPEASKRRGR